MRSVTRLAVLAVLALTVAPPLADAAGDPFPMKFNEVKEVAPGVFFRYASISAVDKSVVFGGSNHIWIVFQDYVFVFDANFPKEAADVIKDIKKTTKKPIRYVVDSHHHGDHAYGNAVWAKEGATIISQKLCADWLRTKGPKEFEAAGKGKTGRPDIRDSFLKVPDLIFDDKLVLDDGTQRVELLFLGHAHTPGDAFLYLPKHKLLCTGDACVNGAFNYTGHADTASWIRVMERAQQLDVKYILPGHGPIGGKDLLTKQRQYFIDLRAQIQKGIDAGKDFADIAKSIDIPWYKDWTGVTAGLQKENIDHVYAELSGRIMPWDLIEQFGVYEGASPTKETPGWTAPKRIVVPNLMPARLAELKRVAPEVFFVPVNTAAEAAKEAVNADAVLGFCTDDIVRAGKKLRWIQTGAAGVEKNVTPTLKASSIVLTNTARIYGPNVSDQAMGLLLTLSRGMAKGMQWTDGNATKLSRWDWLKDGTKPTELHQKTMLIVGLGGIGTQIAQRAHGFGMRVMAIDPNEAIVKPDFVFSLDRPAKLMDLLPKADVVVLACPLTEETKGMIGAVQFKAMKPSALFINIARGGIVRQDELVDALRKKHIAGAGLDVTDPEPLPNDHPLWKMPNVAISPHLGGQSAEARDRQWRLWRENVRRFVAGERLLCVVDKEKGY